MIGISFHIKKDDLRPVFVVNLVDDYAEPTEASVNLTTAGSACFSMLGPIPGTAVVIDRVAGTITDAAAGEFTYQWKQGDTATPGTYRAETVVFWNDGKPETFPNSTSSGDDGTAFWTIVIADNIS